MGSITTNITLTFILLIVCMIFRLLEKYFKVKSRYLEVIIDGKELRHVTRLMPWIYAQVAKSTEVVLDNYNDKVRANKFPKEINTEQYLEIISDIRTHFYGTVPKSLSDNMIRYISEKQIDILILAQFRKANVDGGFKIKK